ncbi:hypothetical protein EV586_1043 [Tumebacillus sp. BK434]|uniref:hypothetical protein n=1 Tax=Tumebacillus sp. BK434 TaxID=2512169 RepID=UPI0010436D17|nr:hypothetical protein [Tumebacillus sp. BK434]TCP54386.1 hypothetical protein EV586_1043 [Tumebacillus sp. BK434]
MTKTIKAVLCTIILAAGLTGAASAATKEDLPNQIVETMRSLSGISTDATPTVTSRVTASTNWNFTAKATATSDSTAIEDWIYAKARIYSSKGVLLGQAEDDQDYSNHAGASVSLSSIGTGADYALGNHTYIAAGYKTVYHETKDYY